jgi:mono/diheme cytochrome c family protein
MADPIMIPGRMSRSFRVLLLSSASIAVAALMGACGTEHIDVPQSQASLHRGATLFSERCAGCHTLSYAGTWGSAPNIRTALQNSGPNFNQRCERPIDRVLYAIENGGFSGAYMPQNVVVGQDAIDVAKFVATFAGRQATVSPGVPSCVQQAIGTLPPGSGTVQVASTTTTTSTTSTFTTAAGPSAVGPKSKRSKAFKKSSNASKGTTKKGTTKKSGSSKSGKTSAKGKKAKSSGKTT